MKKKLFFIGIILVIGMVIALELPVVLGLGVTEASVRIKALQPIELSGKTLFVSDFHLKSAEVRVDIDETEIKQFVIVGDFFHGQNYFEQFGETQEERIRKGLETFLPLGFQGNVYFISAYTHDPQLEPFTFGYGDVQFFHVGKLAKFSIDGVSVVALHGNELHRGVFGGGISWLFQKFGIPLPLERLGRFRFGIEKEIWFVTGHSHVPALHFESKTMNTGSFVGVPFNDFFRIHVGTGIVVEQGEVELLEFSTPHSAGLFLF
jgi:predicted phosphodiesterase